MTTEAIIFGFQALAGALLIFAARASRRRDEKATEIEAKKEEGRGVLVAILSDAFKKAKGRGALRGGYDRSLGICALSECLNRLQAGKDVDPEVVASALELLGLHLERDEAGEVIVCEN